MRQGAGRLVSGLRGPTPYGEAGSHAGRGKASGMLKRGSAARRAVLGASVVILTAVAWWSSSAYRAGATVTGETRTLTMYNIHTKDTITVTYKRDGKYDETALARLNTFMRDWRADKEIKMDPELIDHIWILHKELGSQVPVHLICGYRTASTNENLRRHGGGQAKRSQHILGKAADITFPDVPVKVLRNSALVWEWGGVGYYPTSGVPFVHVDTGRVRMWPRIPRLELAALFPSGHSKYIPADNKPITRADYKLALAQGLVKQTQIAQAVRIKPAPEPEDVADADDDVDSTPAASPASASAAPVVAENEAPAVPEPEIAKPILASYTPSTPAEHEIAADVRSQGAPPPPQRLFAYASAGGMPSFLSFRPKPEPAPAPKPAYRDAEVVGAPEADDDHPDELSYVPFDIGGLMTDRSVAYSRTVAPLTAPDQAALDYLFEDMDQPTALSLRKSSGYRGLAAAQQFSGQAVRNLYAEMKAAPSARTQHAEMEPNKPALTQVAQR
jgi:uncharacterized protein YcbK (DUF882 family)